MNTPKDFFYLSQAEQNELIITAAYHLGIAPAVVEKDLWVCWALKQLFSTQLTIPLAFKGGTSLSKVFGLIQRFSEDIDITIDYRELTTLEQPLEKYTKTFIKKLTKDLKHLTQECITQIILPHLQESPLVTSGFVRLEINADNHVIKIYYPTMVSSNNYLPESITIEFGGRNVVEPSEKHTVQPYLAKITNELIFPVAVVKALSPSRTFWEKVTLIHVECHRGRLAEQSNRLSRHWYDLAMLFESPIGHKAITDLQIALDVIKA